MNKNGLVGFFLLIGDRKVFLSIFHVNWKKKVALRKKCKKLENEKFPGNKHHTTSEALNVPFYIASFNTIKETGKKAKTHGNYHNMKKNSSISNWIKKPETEVKHIIFHLKLKNYVGAWISTLEYSLNNINYYINSQGFSWKLVFFHMHLN